jgi:DNA helicase HerA-like ATPase
MALNDGGNVIEPANTLIVGMTGSGKTWFARRYLINVEPEPACRFLFDESSRWSKWLPIRPCFTWADCDAALPSRWVLFNPSKEYPDDYAKAFDQFCQYVYSASGGGPGSKILAVQELWQWCDARTMPRGFRLCTQAGREQGIQLLLDTQEPHRINSSIIGQTTELVCFRLDEEKALECIRGLRGEPETVMNLPLGQFIALNRLSRGTLHGKLF